MALPLPPGWSTADFSATVDPIIADCARERVEWIYARTPQDLLTNVGQWLATGSTSAPLPTAWTMAEFTVWVTNLIAAADAAYNEDVFSKLPYALYAPVDSYLDAETPANQWVAAVIANGGTVSAARKSIIQSFIAAEIAAGTWALTDDYWALWAENPIQALTSIKQRRLATTVGAPVFLPNRHYEFDGVANYINTGFVASTHAVAMTTDSARIAVYERTNVASNGYAAGVHSSTSRSLRVDPRTAASVVAGAAMYAAANYTLPLADSRGLTAASRSAGSASAAYRNAVALVQTAPPASFGVGVPDLPLFIGAYNIVTTGAISFRASPIGFVSAGASLSAQQEKDQFDNIQSWAIAVGAAVVGQDEVTLWANAVLANGGSISTTRRAQVGNLVAALKASSTWDLIDDLWLLVAENQPQALTSLKQRRLAVAINAPAFTIDRGYAFDGTNYIDTGFVPSVNAMAMTGTNMHIAVYERSNLASTTVAAGCSNSSTQNIIIYPRNSGGLMQLQLDSQGIGPGGDTSADSRGLSVGSRNGTLAADILAYRNGVTLLPFTPGTLGSALATFKLYIGANNGAGTPGAFRAATEGFVSVGAAIPAAQQWAFYRAIQTFMAAVGAEFAEPPSPPFDFMPGTLPAGATLTRASVGWAFTTPTPALTSHAVDAPRWPVDPLTGVLRGLFNEPAATNGVRNASALGAVAGTPGTSPPNWTVTSTANNVTREIKPTGTEGGIAYFECRYSGLPSASGAFSIAFDAATQIAALPGQSWIASFYMRFTGGSLANLTNVRLVIAERNAGGTQVTNGSFTIVPTGAPLASQLFSGRRVLTDPTTAFVQHNFSASYTINQAVDITFRIGLPQLVQAPAATSPIVTTTVALTRAADILTLAIPSSVWDIDVVRASGTQKLTNQTVGTNGWVVPADPSPVQSVTARRAS